MARKAHQREKQGASYSYDSSTSHNTTDEEYFALIAGDADDDEDEEEQPWMKRVREAFETADVNADGTLTLAEAKNLFMGGSFGGGVETKARLDALEAKMDRIIQLLEAQQR